MRMPSHRILAVLKLFALAALVLVPLALGSSFLARPAGAAQIDPQNTWRQLPALDSRTSPAISGHSDGRVYVAAVAFSAHMYYTSTASPGNWAAWQSVGPAHKCNVPPFCFDDPAVHFDASTPPVLVRDGSRLYLFARGTNDDLYETHKDGGGGWSTWRRLTNDGRVRGRLSVAITRSKSGTFENVHVAYASASDSVEYRAFDASWAQVAPADQWSSAVEATIATDGVNEVWAAIRTTGRSLLIQKKAKPWSSTWQAVTSRLAEGPQGEYFDISNLVFFGGAYHVAYSLKYLCDDVSGRYCHTLEHARFRAGLPDDGYIRTIASYTPSGDNHPLSELSVYRNKLVMAYKDGVGWVRYARWDNSDPPTPWIGTDIVATGSTSHRPALAPFNRRPFLTGSDYGASNYGNDLFAAVNGFSNDRLYFINFSRAIFIRDIDAQFDVYNSNSGSNCVPQSDPLAPTLITDISKDGRPFFTELGFILWVLPDWLSNHVYKDAAHRGFKDGNTSGRFALSGAAARYPIIIKATGNIGICSGIWVNRGGDYRHIWEELGHTTAGAMGFSDNNSNPPTATNVTLTGIALSDLLEGFEIFGRNVNTGATCQLGADASGRCRGFTGHAGNYDVRHRQHSFLYVFFFYYFGDGDRLRRWVQDDLANGVTLLQEKYNWGKERIFRGVEFRRDGEPLVAPGNDQFARSTGIAKLPFKWAQDTTRATTETGEPAPCGSKRNTVWFSYTAGASGQVTVNTLGSDFDTVVAVYTGNSVGALTTVVCNDDKAAPLRHSRATFSATKGTTYRIQVGGFQGRMGQLRLSVTVPTPANDNFASAVVIPPAAPLPPSPYVDSRSTVGSTTETGEPAPCGRKSNTVWYRITPDRDARLTANTFSSNYDTVLAAYTGSTLGTLTLVPGACNDDSGGFQSQVSFQVTAGTTYHLQVGGYRGRQGQLRLTVSMVPKATPTPTPTGVPPTDTPTPRNTATPTPTGRPLQGDVNCDTLVNVVDALFVLQGEVGQRVDSGGCPLPPPPPDTLHVAAGDVNKDRLTNVVDALFILQCEVGISNSFCP